MLVGTGDFRRDRVMGIRGKGSVWDVPGLRVQKTRSSAPRFSVALRPLGGRGVLAQRPAPYLRSFVGSAQRHCSDRERPHRRIQIHGAAPNSIFPRRHHRIAREDCDGVRYPGSGPSPFTGRGAARGVKPPETRSCDATHWRPSANWPAARPMMWETCWSPLFSACRDCADGGKPATWRRPSSTGFRWPPARLHQVGRERIASWISFPPQRQGQLCQIVYCSERLANTARTRKNAVQLPIACHASEKPRGVPADCRGIRAYGREHRAASNGARRVARTPA